MATLTVTVLPAGKSGHGTVWQHEQLARRPPIRHTYLHDTPAARSLGSRDLTQ